MVQNSDGPRKRILHVETDARGQFACDEVPSGPLRLLASAVGLAPAGLRVEVTRATPQLELHLLAGARVRGRVTDSAGRAVAGAQVASHRNEPWFSEAFPGFWNRETRTDAEGRYVLDAVPPGGNMLTVLAGQAMHATREVELVEGTESVVDIAFDAVGSIRGRVIDAAGAPLAGWTVRARAMLGKGLSERLATTHRDGRFEILELPDATIDLFVFCPDGSGIARSMWRVRTSVRTGAQDVELRVPAVAGAWIRGSVRWPEGVERTRARLSLEPREPGGLNGYSVPMQDTAPADDEFRVGPLPPGSYTLTCEFEGRASFRVLVVLAPGETQELPPFRIDLQVPLVVELRLADGRLVDGAGVRLVDEERGWLTGSALGRGRYRTQPALPGSYMVHARGAGFVPFAARVDVTADAERPVCLTVAAGQPVELRFLPPTKRDRWVAAAQLRLRDAAGAEVLNEWIQIDGGADFVWRTGLRPGHYVLEAKPFDSQPVTVGFDVESGTDRPLRVDVQFGGR